MGSSSHQAVYGINTVGELIKHHSQRIVRLHIADDRHDKRIQALVSLAEIARLPIEKCGRDKLDALLAGESSANHQGVVALCEASQVQDESYLKALLKRTERPVLLLILDGVTDPHNLGACLRSADAAGADAVIVPKDNAVSLTPVVRKVASGAAETIPLIVAKNLARCIKSLQESGIWIMGAAGESEKRLFDIDFSADVAIAMGAEGGGLRRLTRERCDELFRIPMSGSVESLNVSVAAGICLFEVLRQRE